MCFAWLLFYVSRCISLIRFSTSKMNTRPIASGFLVIAMALRFVTWAIKKTGRGWLGCIYIYIYQPLQRGAKWFRLTGVNSPFLRVFSWHPDLKVQVGIITKTQLCRDYNLAHYKDLYELPSLKLTKTLKMVVSNRKLVFQPSIFRGYVSFSEGNQDFMVHVIFFFRGSSGSTTPLGVEWFFAIPPDFPREKTQIADQKRKRRIKV